MLLIQGKGNGCFLFSNFSLSTTLIGYGTSGELLKDSDPQFLSLYKGLDSYFISVVKINDLLQG